MISTSKVAEEVGFDKINTILAQLNKLKIVIVDGLNIYRADDPGEIKATCPLIVELDLSRNLFEDMEPIFDICGDLEALKILKLKYVIRTHSYCARSLLIASKWKPASSQRQ